MVDYSKWDSNMDLSDDEEPSLMKQTVTKLGSASKVTIDKTGTTIYTDATNYDYIKATSTNYKDSSTTHTLTVVDIPTSWTKSGSYVNESFYWSQTSHEVTIRVILPSTTSAKDIKVNYTNSFEDNRRLEIHASSTVLINDILLHDFQVDSEDGLLWEIETFGGMKYLTLTFMKKSLPGAIIWWDRVFVNDPSIDVTKIEGRKVQVSTITNVWEEAHRMFREKVSQRNAHHVEYQEDVDEDE